MEKVKITWNGKGGELDSVVVSRVDGDTKVTAALIKLIEGNIVNPGDSFEIEEIA